MPSRMTTSIIILKQCLVSHIALSSNKMVSHIACACLQAHAHSCAWSARLMNLDSCIVRCFISIRIGSCLSYQGAKWDELPNIVGDLISIRTGSCPSYQGAKWLELPRAARDIISRRTEPCPDIQRAKWTEPPKKVDMSYYK